MEEGGKKSLKNCLGSILGRLRQISREVAILRASQERLEPKLDALSCRVGEILHPSAKDKKKIDENEKLESDKENFQAGNSCASSGKSSDIPRTGNRKRDNSQVDDAKSKKLKANPVFHDFATAETAIRKLNSILAQRKARNNSIKTLRSPRREALSEYPKGYWKLDFTDTSTQSS